MTKHYDKGKGGKIAQSMTCWGLLALSPSIFAATDAEHSTPPTATIAPVLTQDSLGFHRFIQDRLAIYVDSNYYQWQSATDDSKGHQYVTPITVTYRADQLDIGIRGGFINSKNDSIGREGEVSTWGDTNLSFAYTQPILADTSLRLSLDQNLPTGRETLAGSQKNAVMDGALVQQTRFGEGYNTTAGFSMVKNLTAQSLIGLGYSHTWRGAFEPNGDMQGSKFDAGDENRISVQGQLGGQKYLLIGGLNWTTSDVTKFNDSPYYRKGDRLDANITGIVALPYAQQLTFGEYSQRIYDKHTAKFNVSYLEVDANSYDQLNDLYNAGRDKFEFGLGYSYQWTAKQAMNVGIKRMYLKDKATPATLTDIGYSGWNVMLGLNWEF